MRHKQFYYKGKNYYNADYTEIYTRASRWIKVNFTLTEEARPYIRHNNKRYYLDEFLRAGSPWSAGITSEVKAADGEAVTLAGYQADVYYKPYFMELSEDGEAARLYRYEGSNTEY